MKSALKDLASLLLSIPPPSSCPLGLRVRDDKLSGARVLDHDVAKRCAVFPHALPIQTNSLRLNATENLLLALAWVAYLPTCEGSRLGRELGFTIFPALTTTRRASRTMTQGASRRPSRSCSQSSRGCSRRVINGRKIHSTSRQERQRVSACRSLRTSEGELHAPVEGKVDAYGLHPLPRLIIL